MQALLIFLNPRFVHSGEDEREASCGLRVAGLLGPGVEGVFAADLGGKLLRKVSINGGAMRVRIAPYCFGGTYLK